MHSELRTNSKISILGILYTFTFNTYSFFLVPGAVRKCMCAISNCLVKGNLRTSIIIQVLEMMKLKFVACRQSTQIYKYK